MNLNKKIEEAILLDDPNLLKGLPWFYQVHKSNNAIYGVIAFDPIHNKKIVDYILNHELDKYSIKQKTKILERYALNNHHILKFFNHVNNQNADDLLIAILNNYNSEPNKLSELLLMLNHYDSNNLIKRYIASNNSPARTQLYKLIHPTIKKICPTLYHDLINLCIEQPIVLTNFLKYHYYFKANDDLIDVLLKINDPILNVMILKSDSKSIDYFSYADVESCLQKMINPNIWHKYQTYKIITNEHNLDLLKSLILNNSENDEINIMNMDF